MADRWEQDDARLRPVPPERYPWVPLPAPPRDDATVRVSLLATSTLTLANDMFSTYAHGEQITAPCWSFLIEKDGRALMWDLGLRENAPKKIVEGALKQFEPHPHPGPIQQLTDGGFDVSTIDLVVLSHEHFDRAGDLDTLPKPAAPVLLGPGALESIGPGFPSDPNAAWPKEWLDTYRFVELPGADAAGAWTGDVAALKPPSSRARQWEAVACFERAVDWFGDGSLWLTDAPGHSAGHIMALARVTTNPATYIMLGGDSTHSQDLYLPVPRPGEPDFRSPLPVLDGAVQLAIDPAAATRTIGALTRLSAEDNIMVVLSHEPEIAGVVPRWPASLNDWQRRGWKEAKETGLACKAAQAARAAADTKA